MNILHITPSFYPAVVYGGPTHSVYQLCRDLARNGHNVKVLTTDANGPRDVLKVDTLHEVELEPGLRVRYCHRVIDVSVSPALLRLLPAYVNNADIVHLTAVYSFPTLPVLWLCRLKRKPLIWSPRGMLQRWQGMRKPFLKTIWERFCKIIVPRAAVLHCTSENEASESAGRIPGIKTVVVPNAIEIPNVLPGKEERSEPTPIRFLYLGRLHPKKGIENLLDAFQMLNAVPSTLVVAGEGDRAYTDSLKVRVSELQLSDRVRMVGAVHREEKDAVFAEADCAIVPSYSENFALVVAEALARSVPVIAARGTPWKGIDDHGCGMWVENDSESLALAMKQIARLPLREMGKRGREWMRRDFSPAAVTDQMVRVYKEAIGCHESN